MIVDRDYIIKLLETNNEAVCKALVTILKRNAFLEKDARIGKSHAEFYIAKRYLSDRQIAFWKTRSGDGIRIAYYCDVLMDEVREKHEKV